MRFLKLFAIILVLSVFYFKPFGLDKWNISTNFGVYKEASNIDFYEGQAALMNVSVMYRF